MQKKQNKIFVLTFFLFLYFLSIDLRASNVDPNAKPTKCNAPAWTKLLAVPTEAVPLKSSQVNMQCLLIDTQRHWEEKTLYQHIAIKAVTNRGVEGVSQVKINFDPSYTQVHMHTIRVFRQGAWSDRLENARYQFLQREMELEENLYDGEHTLVYFLKDIRQGDIVEYSYSLVGNNPLFDSHFTDMIDLQRDVAVEKIAYRLLARPDLYFQIKPVNTEIKPKVATLSRSLREWSWEATQTEPCFYNDDLVYIQLSQYKTWGELAQTICPIHSLPHDFAQSIPAEMQALVQKWKETVFAPEDRALLALRFVQDEIRYLGIEDGVGGWKPRDPSATFLCRFGDCKDKSFLLHALLKLMDISSTPLLVNAGRGEMLPDMLPSPYLFNHCVLQMQIDGAAYHVDPTISLQGGSLETNAFPDYEYGLLLSKETKDLIPLPDLSFAKPAQISSSFSSGNTDGVRIQISSVFYGFQADACRQMFTWGGPEEFSLASLLEIQSQWGEEVSLDEPLAFFDDRFNNVFTIVESYFVPIESYWMNRDALLSLMRSRAARKCA